MANKKKPAAPAAPAVETKVNNKPAAAPEIANEFQNMLKSAATGLDPNHQVDLLSMLNQRFFLDKEAPAHTGFNEEAIAKINEITACGLVAVMAEEIVNGNSNFAIRMKPTQLAAITDVCQSMGISINPNLLPAPETDGTIKLPAEAMTVSEETKEKIKEEQAAANKEVVLDPTKIENDEQLYDAIRKIMIKEPNLYGKIAESIAFYRSYKELHEDKEKLAQMSDLDLFDEISKKVGKCPLVISGAGHFMYTTAGTTKSPVAAFCALRNACKNRKTGVYALDDSTVAEYTKIIIRWDVDCQTQKSNDLIETYKKDIALLSADKDKNADGIKDLEEKIATQERNIAHFEEVLGYVMSPTCDFVENFEEKYLTRDTDARRTFKSVVDSYYDDIEVKEMKQNIVLANVCQYVGIITNLFREPGSTIEGYSMSNIQDLEPIETTEEKPAEESKK